MVAIIIPCYNMAEYVGYAIDSAANQTYPDIEVWVIDDCSTDNSRDEIFKAAFHSGEQVIPFCLSKNEGLNAVRNRGARYSKGKAVLFLDADDMLDPEYVEKTLPLLANPTVGVVSTDMYMFGEVNRIQPIGRPCLEIAKRANTMPYCSLIRRDAFNDVKGYSQNPDIQYYGDWDLWLRIMNRGWKVETVAEPLFNYRVRPTSMRTEVESRHQEMYEAIRKGNPDIFPETR